MTKMHQDLFDCLQRANTQCENMQNALQNIFANTINKNFGIDIRYKHNVLSNIKMSIGENLYEIWMEQYKDDE